MAFRFQRRITLAPGIRLNLSKRGVGFSVGPRGASVSIGPSGAHAHAGIPGSGLAYRTKLNAKRGRSGSRDSASSLATSALAERVGRGETLALTLKVNSDSELRYLFENGTLNPPSCCREYTPAAGSAVRAAKCRLDVPGPTASRDALPRNARLH